MGKLFGTDGVRGITFTELTPELAFRVSAATCTHFGEGSRLLIGRDVRIGGSMLESAVISGLLFTGCKPVLLGYIPTPGLQYNVAVDDSADGGIMITASHNPPEYNGLKVIDSDGIEIPRWKEYEIEKIIFEDRIRPRKWEAGVDKVDSKTDAIDTYIRGILDQVDGQAVRKREYKVIVDAANSVGSLSVPRVVKSLGGKVITLNGHLDPTFPGREPEPTPASLTVASKLVLNEKADMGVGLDGDADRSIFIDDKGRVHWGDRLAIPLAIFLSRKHPELPRRVYTGVSSSFFIEEPLKREGIEVVWMKVGSVDISRRLASEGGLMGFEENGGTMYPLHHPVRDAAMTTALVMEMLAAEGRSLSEIIDSYYPKTYTIKTKIPMPREKAIKALDIVKEHYKGNRIVDIDGVKILKEDSWLLVRPSGTEPVIRIMIEAKDESKAIDLLEEVKTLINQPG